MALGPSAEASQGGRPAAPPHTLGPDGKPCKACSHASSMLQAFSKMHREGSSDPAAPSATSGSDTPPGSNQQARSATTSSAAEHTGLPNTSGIPKVEASVVCPPDVTEIGRATWTFLHSVAAYYPEQPSQPQKTRMKELIRAVGEFYPCEVCAEHFREEAKQTPPDVSNNTTLSLWFCRMHNKVNEVLGKPIFDCSKVLERWKDGPSDGSCD